MKCCLDGISGTLIPIHALASPHPPPLGLAEVAHLSSYMYTSFVSPQKLSCQIKPC
jgi:hypothetical protein